MTFLLIQFSLFFLSKRKNRRKNHAKISFLFSLFFRHKRKRNNDCFSSYPIMEMKQEWKIEISIYFLVLFLFSLERGKREKGKRRRFYFLSFDGMLFWPKIKAYNGFKLTMQEFLIAYSKGSCSVQKQL